jgi:hypothetical protein
VSNQELEPSVEIAHLRRLLDAQPSCLLRVAADGTVLAANDAARMLLGVASLAETLGRDIADWIREDQRDPWRAFALKVVAGAPASVECDVTPSSGEPQLTRFHGIPLDHPDGVASMAVVARVVTAQHRLETAVVELEARVKAGDEALAAAEAACRAAETDRARALADVRQLEMALGEFGSRRHQSDAERAQLHEAQQALAAAEQREREARTERDALERRLEEAQQQALATAEQREREARTEREEVERRLEETQQALATAEQREREVERRLEEMQQAVAGAEQRAQDGRTEREEVERRLEQAQQAVAGAEQRAQEADAERSRLEGRLEQTLAACADREAALGRLQADHDALAAAHAAAATQRDECAGALREHAAHLQALADRVNGTGGDRALAGAASAAAPAASAGRQEGPA